MAESEVIRELGTFEKFSSARHHLSLYHCLATTCRYIAPQELPPGRSLRGHVESAIAKVVLEHAALRVSIAGDKTPNARFFNVPRIDLQHQIRWLEAEERLSPWPDSHLLRALEEQHSHPFPEVQVRPPWRAIVVHHRSDEGQCDVLDIALAVHHSIADGKSTAVFHSHLLRVLGETHPLTGPVVSFEQKPALLPPQEQLIKFETTWLWLFRTIWQELAPAWLKQPPPPAPWTGGNTTLQGYHSHLRTVFIPSRTVTGLIAACRTNGATLTSLIHAMVLFSLARQLPSDQATSFLSTTPISLRPYVTPGPYSEKMDESMVNLVGVQMHRFDGDTVATVRKLASAPDKTALEKQLWTLSKVVRDKLKEKLDSLPKNDILGVLHWAGDWHKWLLGKLGKPRETSWEVSNIGVLDQSLTSEKSDWKIEWSLMSQCAPVIGAAISCSMSAVKGGPVILSFSWQDGIVDTELVDGLVQNLQHWLDKFGQSGKFGL